MKVPTAQVSPLSFKEEQALRDQEQHLQDVKKGAELTSSSGENLQGTKYIPEDIEQLNKKLNQIKETLDRRGVNSSVQGPEREQLDIREKKIREFFYEIHPSFREHMDLRPSDGPRYSRYVQQIQRNQTSVEYQRAIKEWKDIRRRLDPENPYAADVRELYRQ